jgi:hypothetical protein
VSCHFGFAIGEAAVLRTSRSGCCARSANLRALSWSPVVEELAGLAKSCAQRLHGAGGLASVRL